MAAGFAYLAVRSGDPLYTFYEWMSPARFQQYDRLIRSVALEHHLDPMLVKAVVWRESRFDPKKHGSHGERGLMQVTEKAANEWARENKVAGFRVDATFRSKNQSGSGNVVFASRNRTLGPPGRSHCFRSGGIQRRSQSRPALERRKRRLGDIGAPVSSKHRFSCNAQIHRVNRRSLQILSATWKDVSARDVRNPT